MIKYRTTFEMTNDEPPVIFDSTTRPIFAWNDELSCWHFEIENGRAAIGEGVLRRVVIEPYHIEVGPSFNVQNND